MEVKTESFPFRLITFEAVAKEMTEKEALYIENLEKELRNLKEQSSSQLEMYEMTTVYMEKLQKELKESQHLLLETNTKLTDSINYSKRIQDAFIIQIDVLRKIFPKSFVFQKPKDIVSGDFVWAYKNDNITFLGVGDCTGHGVPGAMLSIFIISMLNQIVNQYHDETPASILDKLDQLITKYLSQYTDTVKDSAEISIIKYDANLQTLTFAGANRPLALIRNNKLSLYKGAKFVLGNDERRLEMAEDKEVEIQPNDMLYMFSDGFPDQFGGEKKKKFSTRNLLSLLEEISNTPISEQYETIESTFNSWKGNVSQIDDVTLLGLCI